MMKSCCVCKKPLVGNDEGYPQFMTDPENPELICRACLPQELVRSFQKMPKAVREEVLKQFAAPPQLH
jgi:recombinational DNA repair protein (RecF pathway)